ncbi:isochorismatase family protein [Pseudomonas sp. Marseille-QA0892]
MQSMKARASVLVLVDYQDGLMPVIADASELLARAGMLAETAALLGVPVIGTEQNPGKLGGNVAPIASRCDRTVAKMHFDACRDGLVDVLDTAYQGRDDVVIAGCEAHVCLMQTALGLLRAGKRVWVVADACGARRGSDHAAAMARLQQAGATVVTADMVMFEWLETCENERFRDVLPLVKAMP